MAEETSSSEQAQRAPESGAANGTPTIPAQPAPKKPIKTIWIAAYALMGLAALGLISNLASLHSQFTTPLPKSPYTEKPSTVMPDAVTSFRQEEQEQIRKLEQENAEAQRAAQRAAQVAEAVGNITAPMMMACTPAIAGTQGTSSAGSPITCGADGQWHLPAKHHKDDRRAHDFERGHGRARVVFNVLGLRHPTDRKVHARSDQQVQKHDLYAIGNAKPDVPLDIWRRFPSTDTRMSPGFKPAISAGPPL
jgi:hypothetical protein